MARVRQLIKQRLLKNLRPLILYVPIIGFSIWLSIVTTMIFLVFTLGMSLVVYYSYFKEYFDDFKNLKVIWNASKVDNIKTLQLIKNEVEHYRDIVNAPTDEMDYHSLNARDEIVASRISRSHSASNSQNLAFFLKLESVAVKHQEIKSEF